ncbi:pentapeptide repeat-containing protein [Amycolatopsis sp. NPDC059657]|uniref:pentapeptide repeat-containing protein n=1 Tax=Amycolatopsis sp. NPDC059657 TaxID=3346899 RepID=UPI00366DBD8D
MAGGESGQRALSNRAIAVCAAGLVGLAVGACWLLLGLYGHGGEAENARLESIRTVGTIVLGAGGAIALLLAARRQQTAEHDLATKRHDLVLRERANDDARHDAEQRRITDLYHKAVEQLGSDKAPARLAGLYALDRLAQDNPPRRQTIVNVISAYLRMPYELPGQPVAQDAARDARDEYRSELQEREVRITAQRILTDHLAPDHSDGTQFWADIDLDLSGALLIDLMLHDCELNGARFINATFTGETLLLGITFNGSTRFDGATFERDAWFAEASFNDSVRFDKVTFCRDARFDETTFVGNTSFRDARFSRDARFDKTTFSGKAVFSGAEFARDANFTSANFSDDAWLPGVNFGRDARFVAATFAGDAWFSQVSFSSFTTFAGTTFTGDIRFDDTTLDGVAYVPQERNPRPVDDLT